MHDEEHGFLTDELVEQLAQLDAALCTGNAEELNQFDPALVEYLEQARLELELVWPSTKANDDSLTTDNEETIQELPVLQHTRLGRYEIQSRLGGGGQGQVHLANDPLLNRQVAIKIPRLHTLFNPQHRRRFEREARLTAGLKHPHIVSLYDTGEADGCIFLISEYIKGPSLDEWTASLPKKSLPCRTAAQIIFCLAQAARYMHEHGVIHRDLKPSNVLLENGVMEDAENWGTPRVTDFGLSHETDHTVTRTGAILGTLAYMAPEQATGKPITHSVDIHALGVMLYELLMGHKPYWGLNDADLMREILESEVPSLRSERKDIPRDLEGIVQKCLAKSPLERYRNAEELEDDLQRYLKGEPTKATPISRTARMVRWCKRRPWTTVSLALIAASIVAVGLVVFRYEMEVRTEKTKSDQRASELANTVYAMSMREITDLISRGKNEVAIEKLQQLIPLPNQTDLRESTWNLLQNRVWNTPVVLLPRQDDFVHSFYMHPSKPHVLVGSKNDVCCWDLHDRFLCKFTIRRNSQPFFFVYSQATQTIATFDFNKIRFIHIADIQNPTVTVEEDPKIPVGIFGIKATDDLQTIVGITRDALYVKNRKTGISKVINLPENGKLFNGGGCILSPDGRFIILDTSHLNSLHIKNVEDDLPWKECPTASVAPGMLSPAVAYQGNICWLGTQTTTGSIFQIDLASGKIMRKWNSKALSLRCIDPHAFAPNDQAPCWIVGCVNGEFAEINLITGSEKVLSRQQTRARNILERDENTVLTLDEISACLVDRRTATVIRKYDLPKLFQPDDLQPNPVKSTDFLPKGGYLPDKKSIVLGGMDGRLAIWRLDHPDFPSAMKHDKMSAWKVTFSPDGKQLISAGDDGCLYFWDVSTRQRLRKIEVAKALVSDFAISSNGQLLLAGSYDGSVSLWNLTTGGQIWRCENPDTRIRSVAISPDGKRLAAGTRMNSRPTPHVWLAVWDSATGKQLKRWTPHEDNIYALHFSPDNRLLYSGSEDGSIKSWNMETFDLSQELRDSQQVWNMHFDGNTLYSAGHGQAITKWNLITGERTQSIKDPDTTLKAVLLTPDRKTLITGGETGPIRFWLACNGQELSRLDVNDKVMQLAISPDGKYLAAACDSGKVLMFELFQK